MAPYPGDYPSPTTAAIFVSPPPYWGNNPYAPRRTGDPDPEATGAYNNQAYPATTSGTPISSSGPDAEQTGAETIIISTNHPWRSGDPEASSLAPGGQHHHSPMIVAAAGAVVALVVVALSLLCCYLLYRKRRRSDAAAAQAESRGRMHPEMKTVAAHVAGPADRSYVRPPTDAPPPALASPSVISTKSSSQPVILSTTMDQSYYTGIDTSDRISLAQSQSSSVTYVEGADEPPPPYRPRSVPPISRETSLRTSNSLAPRGSVRRSRDLIRSPFDDPEEENVSDLEEPPSIWRVEADQLSAVSDLSYQQEPTTTHSTV
jgi:hypothetical protein